MPPVQLHAHRSALKGNPEKHLGCLLEQLLDKKYDNKLLVAADAYAEKKAALVVAQLMSRGYIDRAVLYQDLIDWAVALLEEK